FRVPPGIDLVPTNPYSGAPAGANDPGAIQEAFKSGTEPGLASADATGPAKANGQKPGSTVDQGTGGLY
ncbi:MAG: hypothetical protein ACREHV_12480, partial [Rhizomicrobium sp.]